MKIREIKNLIINLSLIFLCLLHLSCLQITDGSQVVLPPIKDISFLNKDEFWVVTGKGKVFQIINNGQSINKVQFDAPVRQVFFLNANEGWILCEDGWVLATTDGGKSWTKKYQFDNKTNTAAGISSQLVFSDNQTGWIAEGLGVWLTEDGGISWNRLLSDEKISIGDLGGQPRIYFPLNSKIGWLGMSNGIILKTSDSGKSWENVSLAKQDYDPVHEREPNLDIDSLFCLDEKTCWAAIGAYGGLLLTKNGGKSWEAILEKKVKPNTAINSIDFVTPKTGWAVGIEFIINLDETPKSVVLKTTDGGKNWNHIDTTIDEPYFNKIKFIDEQNGWLVSKNSIYKTDDGGKSWKKVFEVE